MIEFFASISFVKPFLPQVTKSRITINRYPQSIWKTSKKPPRPCLLPNRPLPPLPNRQILRGTLRIKLSSPLHTSPNSSIILPIPDPTQKSVKKSVKESTSSLCQLNVPSSCGNMLLLSAASALR
jgi:hypothetical protein